MDALRVLTFNVKLIPSYAKLVIEPWVCPRGWWEEDGGWSDAQRAARIRQSLLGADADVIVLQELYQETERKRLRAELTAAGYLHTTGALGEDWLNEDSGLFVASRYPLRSLRFEEFHAKAGEDGLSDKGLVGIDIDPSAKWPGIDSLHVFGVHLQSGYTGHSVRKRQLEQLARAMRKAVESADRSKTSVMAVGDFNVVGERFAPDGTLVQGWEHQRMMATLAGGRDLGGAHLPGESGFTWDGTVNEWMTTDGDESRKRLDYAFVFDSLADLGAVRTLQATEVAIDPFLVEGRHLSDHFGVVADVRPQEG